jgi:hypothetical protein
VVNTKTVITGRWEREGKYETTGTRSRVWNTTEPILLIALLSIRQTSQTVSRPDTNLLHVAKSSLKIMHTFTYPLPLYAIPHSSFNKILHRHSQRYIFIGRLHSIFHRYSIFHIHFHLHPAFHCVLLMIQCERSRKHFSICDRDNTPTCSDRLCGPPSRLFKHCSVYPWFQASAAVWMKSTLFWDITRLRVVIVYQRYGTYRSHLQGSRSPSKMGPRHCPETSVNNYHSTLRNISEERRSQYKCSFLGGKAAGGWS